MFYDCFTTYFVNREGEAPEMASVPEKELQALIEFAALARAAGPASCNHPADSLEPFELIMDACLCGECGAVLKNYGVREAQALGIAPGWTRLSEPMLSAEIHKALKPAFDLLDYIHAETSSHIHDNARDAMDWAEMVEHNDITRKLERVR